MPLNKTGLGFTLSLLISLTILLDIRLYFRMKRFPRSASRIDFETLKIPDRIISSAKRLHSELVSSIQDLHFNSDTKSRSFPRRRLAGAVRDLQRDASVSAASHVTDCKYLRCGAKQSKMSCRCSVVVVVGSSENSRLRYTEMSSGRDEGDMARVDREILNRCSICIGD
jgi:hypothetical protein